MARTKKLRKSSKSAISRSTRRDYARWRAASLILVYVLMAAHIVHWKITGRTLAPLELNEVMYTLELGIVTAGFIFMVAAILGTAVFGRFFCSWGCHILALQDLSAWILAKLHIKPRPIRSRLLLWVPMIAAGYMFIWPQVVRLWQGRPVATLHLATDAEGWASFATEDFWRNLPGPGVTILTFVVCGFATVYVLGTRTFCRYGCPYGALFGLADRIAPGRIRVGDDCKQCGRCTAACTSHVRVHEEVNRYGMVVNPACLKDLDCVSVCPQQTLRFGFGRPSLFKQVVGETTVRKRYDFSLWEEVLAATVFVAVLFIYRGLYDITPFLLTLALGSVFAYATIVAIRLFRRRDVMFNRWRLRRAGVLTGTGNAFVVCVFSILAFSVHSAFVRYHVVVGTSRYSGVSRGTSIGSHDSEGAIAHLETVQRWGLLRTERVERMLGDLYVRSERWAEAEDVRRRVLGRYPNDPRVRDELAFVLAKRHRLAEAEQQYRISLDLDANRGEAHYGLAGVHFQAGRVDLVERHLRMALQIRPNYAEAHYDLGAMLVERGDAQKGIEHLRECLKLRPNHADAHYNLAVALMMTGRLDDALEEVNVAADLHPSDEQTLAFRQYMIRLLEMRAASSGSNGVENTMREGSN